MLCLAGMNSSPLGGGWEGASYLFSIILSTIGFLRLSHAGSRADSRLMMRMAAKAPTKSSGAKSISPVTMGDAPIALLSKNMPSSSTRKT